MPTAVNSGRSSPVYVLHTAAYHEVTMQTNRNSVATPVICFDRSSLQKRVYFIYTDGGFRAQPSSNIFQDDFLKRWRELCEGGKELPLPARRESYRKFVCLLSSLEMMMCEACRSPRVSGRRRLICRLAFGDDGMQYTSRDARKKPRFVFLWEAQSYAAYRRCGRYSVQNVER